MSDLIAAFKEAMVALDRFGYTTFRDEWAVIRARVVLRLIEHPEDAEALAEALQHSLAKAGLPAPNREGSA